MVSDNSSVLHKSAVTMLLVSCVNPFSCWLQALLSVGNYYDCYTVASLPSRLCLTRGHGHSRALPGGRTKAALQFGSPCAFVPAFLFFTCCLLTRACLPVSPASGSPPLYPFQGSQSQTNSSTLPFQFPFYCYAKTFQPKASRGRKVFIQLIGYSLSLWEVRAETQSKKPGPMTAEADL